VVSTTPRPLYPRERPVPIVQEAGWAPGPVWTCAKNLAPTGIRSPDHPARSQSLYRLSYCAPQTCCVVDVNTCMHVRWLRKWEFVEVVFRITATRQHLLENGCPCVCEYLYLYLLTPWSRVLLEKLTSFRS
jgi:hypothetical protein